ncbi:subtilisin-like serine protease QhpE [Paracoccus zhejiangensis]|uniref:Subtilisin n=1 Tax=Paracoccus zhejiangensis TaxID=1077935 RepID=A0A2H5EVS9_9RHOB|nr:subtilisin [Paracoccus zhejiangensis]AUH63383.1 subtilisin [Paracoccus zhejiangensis]
MAARAPLIGIVDSGGPAGQMQDSRAFHAEGDGPARPDRLGHGSAVAAMLKRAAPDVRLRHAQVFDEKPVTSADRVARAVDWLAADCDLILLSLGLAADRAVLRDACTRAAERGVILVAASPARGAPCWPAAYPDVIAATGDARCGWNDLSLLPGNIIGAWCASPEQGGKGMGGASLAAARVAGHLAAHLDEARGDPFGWLAAQAIHVGPERRRAAAR